MSHKRHPIILSCLLLLLSQQPAALSQDLVWQTLIDSADKSIQTKNYREAERQLNAALKDAESAGTPAEKLRTTLRKLATVEDLQGQSDDALKILTRLIKLDDKGGSQEFAEDLNSLALVQHHLNQCDDAEVNFKKSIAMLEKAKSSGANLPLVLMNLSMLYQDMGRFGDAETTLKNGLNILEKDGTNGRSLATALEQLAKLYTVQNRFSEAEPLLKKSLELKEKTLGLGHAELAQEFSSFGKLYLEQGRTEEAERFFNRSLSLRERELGAEHPDVASSLIDLAGFNEKQQKYKEAIALYEKAILIREKGAGKNSSPVADANRKLAETYFEIDNYGKAELLYQHVIAIDEAIYGKESREVARDLSDLALVYLHQGRYQDSEPLYRRSLAIVEKAAGPEHPDTATCLNNLAYFDRNQGNLAEAETLINRGLAIREKTFGKEHPAVARNLANLAELFSRQNRYAEAEPLLRRAVEIDTATLETTHPDLTANVRDLGRVLEAQKKWTEAEIVYKRLLSLDAQTNVAESVIAADLDSLVKILVAQNKPEEAAPIAKKALYIKEKLPGAQYGSAEETASTGRPTHSGPPRPIKDKWALVVGISNFQDPTMNLRYASKDAIDFKNYLVKDAHFQPDHVKLLTDKDATRENIVGHLGEKWLKRLANPDDLVVIYVSGHGSSSKKDANDANFIVPYDGTFDNIVFHGIPMQWLTAGIKDMIHCDRCVLVLDVCHSGAVALGAKGLKRQSEFNTKTIVAGEGQIILAASQADQLSWESKKYANGVFTGRLLEGLRRNGDKTKLQDAFSYVKEQVEQEVLRDRAQLQTPVMVTKWWQGDDVVLAETPVKPRPGLEATASEPTPTPTAKPTGAKQPAQVAVNANRKQPKTTKARLKNILQSN